MKGQVFVSAGVLAVSLFVGRTGLSGVFDATWIRGETDKDAVSYAVDEKMTFTLTVENFPSGVAKDGYWFDWRRGGDDGVVVSGRVALAEMPFVYTTSIDCPGFVELSGELRDAKGNRVDKEKVGPWDPKFVFFHGGAGAAIEKLGPCDEPKDFDAFWQKQFKRLDLIPIRDRKVEIPSPNPDVRLYAASVDCAGLAPVTGYLAIPKAVDRGAKFPARTRYHGYDGNIKERLPPTELKSDEIYFEVTAHGMRLRALGGTDADYKALRWRVKSNGQTYGFDVKENEDPETAYFNGMVLRVKRSLQYVKTLPGWDGKNLKAAGGSQGGLQTMWAAGCGEGVTAADSSITWCCDIRRNSTRKGWFMPWTESMGYFDAVNWGKRAPRTCSVDISRAGLGDYTCPPMGIARLYNAMTCPKRIAWVQGSTHGYVPPSKYPGRDAVRSAN